MTKPFVLNFFQGDDGAALIIECERQPVVVGIQSYCVSSNFPTIFTRISKYFYWIQKHINYGACALRCTLPYYNGKDRNDDGSDNCNYYGSQDGRFHGPHNNYETYKDGNVPYTGYYNGQNGYASYPTYKAYNIGNSHPYHYNRYGSYNAYNPNYNDGIPDYKKERSDLKSNSSSKSSTIIGNNLSQMKSPIASYKRVG